MESKTTLLLSGNEAIALAARDSGVKMGVGYPGTPSTEILETLRQYDGPAQWAPNEKVALEVGAGASFAGARTIVTMKHVGLNVAADPLFTLAYIGATGGLVIVSADDPGMASSQNEQDNRRYAQAAGVPMLEPSDSQEAYDFTLRALEISERFKTPVLLRVTTRVCHSKTIVTARAPAGAPAEPNYVRDVQGRVMVPANARPAHRRLRKKLAQIAAWNETSDLNRVVKGETADGKLGIIASGIAVMHAQEAAPHARVLKLGMTYPLPMETIRNFVNSVERCVVIEEGDPYLVESIRAVGVHVEGADALYRFGELSVSRVRRILAGDLSDEPAPPPGKPPQLCLGCPHRKAFEALRDLGCIVTGDIGCYTLGVLPPFNAMDTCLCMGASIGVGLGMRHVLPEDQARKVVSVIGDSTFMHSGITGLVEMVYNRPKTGHVVLILDNSTTAMTGLQEHPGTGRKLDHSEAHQVDVEALAKAIGIEDVFVVDSVAQNDEFRTHLAEALKNDKTSVLIVRKPCLLAVKKLHALKQARKESE